jgi:glycerol-3-phosphate acyltransferase PlsY
MGGNQGAIFIAMAIGYLLGSIPFGLLLTRMAGLGDVRKIGSGNIGATNVLRTGNKPLAAATLLLDCLKGTAAVLIGSRFGADAGLFAGSAAFAGHCFPIWLKFAGGKGVATYIGILGGVAWQFALAFMAIWIAVAIVTRYSSLSALVATAVSPAMMWIFGSGTAAALFAVMTAICWWKHRTNISRLLSGSESRIGAKV